MANRADGIRRPLLDRLRRAVRHPASVGSVLLACVSLIAAGCDRGTLVTPYTASVAMTVTGTGSGSLFVDLPGNLLTYVCELVDGTPSADCSLNVTVNDGNSTLELSPVAGTNLGSWGGDCAGHSLTRCSKTFPVNENTNGTTQSFPVTVAFSTQDADRVAITPSTATITTLGAGGAIPLNAEVFNLANSSFTGSTITWGSDDAAIASVVGNQTSATVTGVADGTTTIWATADPATPGFTRGTATISVAVPSTDYILFFDFDLPTSWGKRTLSSSNGASTSDAHVATGGNPGGYYAITHALPAGSALSPTSLLVAYSPSAGYDPSSQGAITSLDYSLDQRVGADSVGSGLILYQNLTDYLYRPADVTSTTWASVSFPGLTATDFVRVAGPGPLNPDFSATGSPMSIDVATITDGYMETTPGTRVHHIDNVRVAIHR